MRLGSFVGLHITPAHRIITLAGIGRRAALGELLTNWRMDGNIGRNRCIRQALPLVAVPCFNIRVVLNSGYGWVQNVVIENILSVLWSLLCQTIETIT